MVLTLLLVPVALVFLVWGILSIYPKLSHAVLGDDQADRLQAMDGLRGVLAISVFSCHYMFGRSYYAGHGWKAPDGHFVMLLGQIPVALFFMISAYLFWSRVIAKDGRLSWVMFYQGRVLRLAPMFYASILFLFVLIGFETDFTLHVSLQDLLKQSGQWMSFGMLGKPDINGVKDTYTIHSIVWTLKYEWILYGALPFMALAWRYGRYAGLFIIYSIFILLSMRDFYYAPVYLFFLAGLISVHVLNRDMHEQEKWFWAVTATLSLFFMGYFFDTAIGWRQAILLFPVFVAAIRVVGPWRILNWKSLRFLGHISYSFYLLHNLLMFTMVRWVIGYEHFNALSDSSFYATGLGIGIAITVISTMTFLLIEKPFFTRGKQHRMLQAL